MTVTVTDDMTCINSGDATTGWIGTGAFNMVATCCLGNVQGCNALVTRVSTGVGVLMFQPACCIDVSCTHLYGWFFGPAPVQTIACGGFRLRVSSCGTNGTTCYGEWYVGGSDSGVRLNAGWFSAVVDTTRSFDNTCGTPPTLTCVASIGYVQNILNGSGMCELVADQIKIGSKIFVKGGTCACPGTWDELVTEDTCTGRGVVKCGSGVKFVNAKIEFGDASGTTSTEFRDINQIIQFEDQKVAACFYEIIFDGNACGTNNFRLGTEVGCGIDSKGVSGGVISAPVATPVGIVATDSTMNQVQFFGTTIVGGDIIELKQTNVEFISTQIINSCQIQLECGAELREGSVITSTAASGVGALKLIANPTCPEFRDTTFICNIHALENEINGPITWDLRNIKFACNTQDIRFNHTCCVLTVNILECGDSPTTSDGGGGGTIVVNNNVCVTVTVLNTVGVPVEGAKVGIFTSPVCPGDSALFCGTTNVCGVFTCSHNLMCDVCVTTRVRLIGFKPSQTLGQINMCGLCVPVTFIPCNIADVV